jgi:hypothetical protein
LAQSCGHALERIGDRCVECDSHEEPHLHWDSSARLSSCCAQRPC